MKQIRILIADDHEVVREGLSSVLKTSSRYKIVGEAIDGEEVVRMAKLSKPDILFMDISMPKLNGLEAIPLIKESSPDTRIIILTVHAEEEYLYRVLRAGANSYVLKSAGRKDIIAAIEAVVSGERFLSPAVSDILIEGFVTRSEGEGVSTTKKPPASQKDLLSRRETEILRLIAQGCTNRLIADQLFLSVRTINTHRTNLMKKLDIHDTARLVRFAIEKNIVELAK